MFLNLPDEVILIIAQELPLQCDRYNLVLSCRRMHAVLLPTLYSWVSFGRGYKHTVGKVSRFFNTIARNPKLADAVRYLSLYYWETADSEVEIDCELKYDEKLIDGLVAGTIWSEQPKEQLQLGNTDAWLALLIPQLKSLRKIDIVWPSDETEYVDNMFTKAGNGHIPVFPYLEEAFAGWWDTENSIHSSCMDPFFKFPAMRKLRGASILDCGREKEADEPRITPFSGITDIDLDNSNTECGFGEWIESCKSLKSFRLQAGGGLVSDGPALLLEPLRESLSLHKATLEAVEIHGEPGNSAGFGDGWLGSFVDFHALKFLRISLPTIAREEDKPQIAHDLRTLLPSSLQTLSLCNCDHLSVEWVVDQFDGLLDSRYFPRLTYLALEGCIRVNTLEATQSEEKRQLQTLRHKCGEAGIQFVDYYTNGWRDFDKILSLWPRT